ncbi:MAG TPA: YfiR family protein [Terriglobales bacterium]|nr:YfiR family protein [Terriglobales bacterium]
MAILVNKETALSHTNRVPTNSHGLRRRAQFCALAVAALLSVGGTSARAQDSPSVEYQVKAAFLFNFAKFVDWPPGSYQDEKTPITICVFGYDPFGSALDEIIRGKSINNRELVKRRIDKAGELKTCQIVFVSAREDKFLSEILSNLKGVSALVVGEGENFAERGGEIQFYLENNRVRFAINVDAVQRARLNVSSKLLALAKIVHDPEHPKGN